MKKLILFFIILISIISISVSAEVLSGTQSGVEWKYESGTLTLVGEGNIYFSTSNDASLPKLSDIHTLVLSEGITNVPLIQGLENTLKSIHLPSSVTYVYYSFYKYVALESFTVAENSSFTVKDGVLFSATKLIAYPAGKPDTSYTVPNGTTAIDDVAFTSAKNLTEIKIPTGVSSIGKSAFYNCTSLTSISIPATVTKIPTACFSTCTSLTSIKLPDSITTIGDSAFYQSGLKSITIPKSTTSIEKNAFSTCYALETVNFDCESTTFGESAFANTGIKSLTLPKTGTIPSTIFNGSQLKTLFIPRDVTQISFDVFYSASPNTIYYEGSEAEWNKIKVSAKNNSLSNAKIYFNSLPFSDIAQEHWAFNFVKTLYDNKTVGGTSRTTFEPNATLTWGQAMKMLLVSGGHGEKTPTDSHWASGYMAHAKALGILKDTVSPDGKITRLEFCEAAAKLNGITEQPASNPFKDTDNPSVLALYNKGIIGGTSAVTFEPNATLTRAQIAKIICLLGQ